MTLTEHLKTTLKEAQQERKEAYKEMQKLTRDVIKLTGDCKQAIESVGGTWWNINKPYTTFGLLIFTLIAIAIFINFVDACKFKIPIVDIEIIKACGLP